MESQTTTMLLPVVIVVLIIWAVRRNRKAKRAYEDWVRRESARHEEREETYEEPRIYSREKQYAELQERIDARVAASMAARSAARRRRSGLRHPEQYTKEEIAEAVALGFIEPNDPAVTGDWQQADRREWPLDRSDAEFDDLDSDFRDADRDADYEDSDLQDLDMDDPDLREDLDEDDWDREDAVMRAQASLRIMREEDRNYALDAIEADVLNLDHEPDEDELAAIADREADFYDMSEDYRDY